MTHPDDDAEKAARIAARDMAWEIKGDMGLPEEDYDELIEAFLQGQRHERERIIAWWQEKTRNEFWTARDLLVEFLKEGQE